VFRQLVRPLSTDAIEQPARIRPGLIPCARNTVRDLAVNLGVRFIVVCTESREGELRYSDAIRYDAWRWIQMVQPEENNDDNPVFHLDVVKNRFGPVPKSVRQFYRVGNRLLADAEWIEHSKTNKTRKE